MHFPTRCTSLTAVIVLAIGNQVVGGIVIQPPGGDVVTWTDGAMNNDWHDGANWNVHVPENGDAVIIDDGHHNVWLTENSAQIRSLYVGSGIALYNFHNKLSVRNNADDATTTITGDSSGIVVSDIGGSQQDFNTDYLVINNGAYLRMDGGKAHADRDVDVNGTSKIRGHGVLEVGGGGLYALSFSSSSELRPQNGNLRINMTGDGGIFLGHAYIDVTDGDSDLIIDGDLQGDIGDTLRIGAGNRVDFESQWDLSGQLQFVSGGGEIVGGAGEISGDVSVSSGGVASINSVLNYTAASEATVSSFGTLELGRVSAAAGHVTTLNTASTLRIGIPAAGSQSISWDGHIDANSANFEVNGGAGGQTGIFVLDGSMEVGGSQFWGPTDLQGSAAFYQNGVMDVTGPGGRVHSGIRFQNGSDTTVFSGAELAVHGLTRVDAGAAFNGAGDLVVEQSALLFGEDNAVVDVDVVNHGNVSVGMIFDSSSHLEFADDYVQTTGGTLAIDLAGTLTSQYDRLIVGNDATVAGTLAVSLAGGFEPMLGDDFLVLATGDGLTGTFSTASLPGLDDGLAWEMDYSPFSLTLSVIEDPSNADIDGSGLVTGPDFLAIQSGYGKKNPAAGDATGDGFVTGADFDRWEEEYGSSPAGAAAALGAVPEPTTLMLLAVGMVGLANQHRRKQTQSAALH